MLFDLKGRRKRFIQVTYLILAILFGGGLVLFGVGSGVQGGLVDAITGNNSSGSSNAFDDDVERAERATNANPKNEKAWLALARARYNAAISSDDYDREVGQFEEGAVDDLRKTTQAWERYLEQNPKRPDAGTAALMVQAYATLVRFSSPEAALDLFERAAEAQAVVAKIRPSPIAYFQLAAIQYAIGKIGAGDKAADEAIRLTPKDQRNTVRAQLDDARKDGLKAKKQLKKAKEQAAKAAREARKNGQDPFGAAPGQTAPGGGQSP
jgi:tetratricopeptide (TPR) repeat protein